MLLHASLCKMAEIELLKYEISPNHSRQYHIFGDSSLESCYSVTSLHSNSKILKLPPNFPLLILIFTTDSYHHLSNFERFAGDNVKLNFDCANDL